MSQHPSLKSKSKDIAQRSVRKRYERVEDIKKKENWTEDTKIYGLPKMKIVKFKAGKKTKAKEEDKDKK